MIYRYVNTALELMSLMICLILLFYQLIERRSNNKTNKWFTFMVLCNSAMLVGDLCDWTLGGIPGAFPYYAQGIFSIVVYFAASGLLLFSLYGWLISYIRQKIDISPNWLRVGIALSAIQVLIALAAPIIRIAYIDADNYYQRGKLFPLTQVCPYIVYVLSFYLMIRYRRAFKKRERIYLGIFIVIPLFAELIQVMTYKYSTLNVACSLGLIMVFTFIQSERKLDDEYKVRGQIIDENKRLEELQQYQENLSSQLIDVLCSTVEAKDQYTRGHSQRVAQYAREIMYRMGGDEKVLQEVYYIGLLHDVGKISIDDSIINKKGRLTEEEYEQIKLHTVAGYQILKHVDVIPDLAIGARWHHERYDGTGYPNGLAGDNIPLIARIISVADAYDAMTSNRSYHKIMPQSVVREEISRGMGRQFDPAIARIMLEMIDEDIQYDMKQSNQNKVVSILLIDDDAVAHKLVQYSLLSENYSISSAYGGREGIEMLQESKYDLCLLDMEMPDINGFEVLKWIRKNNQKIKVIFITAERDIEVIRRSEELGADDYITKPINPKILKESIKSLIRH
ncbi:MAG: HD domain-containing phosphohydrolase [Acetatifactor sp.]